MAVRLENIQQAPQRLENIQTQQLDVNQQLQLINQLGGRLPQTIEEQRRAGRPVIGTQLEISQRGKALRQLEQAGVSRQQIQDVLDIQRRVKPGVIGQIKQNLGEDIGGLAGGIAGAKIALTIGQIPPFTALPEEFVTVPLFAGVGAFLGGGTGKSVQQTIDPLATPSISDFVRSGKRQGLFESGGRLVSAGTRLLPIFKRPIKEADDVAEMFARQGGFFTPRQRDSRIVLGATEELSRGSFGGGAIFDGFDIDMQARALNAGKEIIDTIARDVVKDPDILGNELVELFARKGQIVGGRRILKKGLRETLLDNFFKPLYKEAGRLSPNTRLSTVPIKKFIEKKLKQDLAQGGTLLTREGRSRAKFVLNNLQTQRTLGQMVDIRSSYLKDARKFAVGADKSEGFFRELAEVADQALFDPSTVVGMTPEGKKLLRNINAVYGPARELYDEQFIKSVLSQLGTSPSKVSKIVFKDFDFKRLKNIRDILISPVQTTSGIGQTSTNIQKEFRILRQTLPNIKGGEGAARLISKNANEGRALWRQLNATWFAQQLDSAFNPTTKLLDVKKLNKAFEKIPPKTFGLMFPGKAGQGVKDIQKLFNRLARPQKGFVSMFGKTFELGGLTGTSAGLATGSGIAVLSSGALAISPTAYAKLATMGPRATKLLTLGLTAKRGSIKVAPIAARLINLLNEDAEKDQRAILNERKKKRVKTKQQRFRQQQTQQRLEAGQTIPVAPQRFRALR
ncbi:hypothetical protein LCGC14_1777660 [marine sediment metagenome]|uniref:Uncharacterized protein n=1 Tax=marine sediment metagenome TaxID=412755 RepID=A0A0F9GWA0_9ZZZZ